VKITTRLLLMPRLTLIECSLFSHILMLSSFSLLSALLFPLRSCVSYQYFSCTPPCRDWSVPSMFRHSDTSTVRLVVLETYASERNVSNGKRINGVQECTHISSLLMYELKTLTSVIFETSFCITDRSIQFRFSS
jgi:hypothetical protein